MSKIEYRVAEVSEFEAVAKFVAQKNNVPEHHVGYTGLQEEVVLNDLKQLEPSPEGHVFLALVGAEVSGALGLEYDKELGRAWLWGPWVDDEEHWAEVASRLVAHASAKSPPEIQDYELWCDMKNQRLQDFALSTGFSKYKIADVLNFPRAALSGIDPAPSGSLTKAMEASFVELHDTLFPGTYFNGRQLIERQNEENKLIVQGEGETCFGYAFVRVDKEVDTADIDFVGVADDHRGKGLGKQLLWSGIDWIFGFPGIDEVALIVEDGNDLALNLYVKSGFVHERRTIAFRKKLEPES